MKIRRGRGEELGVCQMDPLFYFGYNFGRKKNFDIRECSEGKNGGWVIISRKREILNSEIK